MVKQKIFQMSVDVLENISFGMFEKIIYDQLKNFL